MKTFKIDGLDYIAEDFIQGILVNPELPEGFWTKPISDRNDEELALWLHHVFIWMESEGMKKLYSLDNGCWDRPTLLYASNDLNEIIKYLHDHDHIKFE